jgi:hypothetical protein
MTKRKRTDNTMTIRKRTRQHHDQKEKDNRIIPMFVMYQWYFI